MAQLPLGRLDALLSNARQFFRLIFLLQRLYQLIEPPVDDVGELVERQVDAVIRHAPLRKIIGADALGAIA